MLPSCKSAILLLTALSVVSCGPAGRGKQTAQAADEWVRSFPQPDGELQIINGNGAVEVEGTDGTLIEVRAERVAKATTERAAKDLLTHINIRAEVTEGKLTIQTERIPGVLIGASFEVSYHVKLPASSAIRTRTNGSTTITGMNGHVSASVTNGELVGKALSGGLDLRAVNGNATVDVVRVGDNPIDLRTVNGRLQLTLPEKANANLSATAVNGRTEVTGLPFENFGDAVHDTRRVRGRINAGGTPIELSATNGNIRVTAREQEQ